MNRTFFRTTLAIALFTVFASISAAQQIEAPAINGGDTSSWSPIPLDGLARVGGDSSTWSPPPAFGFRSNLVHGYGYQVTDVMANTAAKDFGLERGDLVTGATVNGIHYSFKGGGWRNTIYDAEFHGGHILLHVMDVRTGRTVRRWSNTKHW